MSDKDKKTTVVCFICQEEIDRDHGGVSCPQNHHICPDCVPNYVNMIMSDPVNLIPVKCMQCHVNIHPPVFERQLNKKQLQVFLNNSVKSMAGEDDQVVECPHCSYFEIWPRNSEGALFFRCNAKECEKVSCIHCKKDCDVAVTDAYNDDDFNNPDSERSMLYHFQCAELAPLKKQFDDALADGTGVVCPNPECRLRGRKDDACTHMVCANCQQSYCYVCGLSVAMCDKSDPAGNIYSHNEGWEYNPNRCPMYLTQIGEIDNRWATEDDDVCVEFLSRIRTISFLRRAYRNIGQDAYRLLRDKYPSIRNCGFTEEDILHGDTRIIVR
mmetsp:Transcript_1887/g.3002  ORF Transcript_1887/g.3002 Transcript_1887/m.3002 type:complete len:327 (-) Transcript_1887:242-1222(-)|eukprot:CAMPEP_0185021944 /NCGR_PEP_ID=MMETSP1103-20130426/4650_1 /TAXON_ID=36769 /ORGANISM="Paraphysomonas bandaiensis, Strain Caron Lab Isolate" /LENGTH=326 /DNA_ID=CAMNT_0027553763 /DNA_START=91 /DNA_END=1071 /DNA_ORIENTATION=+